MIRCYDRFKIFFFHLRWCSEEKRGLLEVRRRKSENCEGETREERGVSSFLSPPSFFPLHLCTSCSSSSRHRRGKEEIFKVSHVIWLWRKEVRNGFYPILFRKKRILLSESNLSSGFPILETSHRFGVPARPCKLWICPLIWANGRISMNSSDVLWSKTVLSDEGTVP